MRRRTLTRLSGVISQNRTSGHSHIQESSLARQVDVATAKFRLARQSLRLGNTAIATVSGADTTARAISAGMLRSGVYVALDFAQTTFAPFSQRQVLTTYYTMRLWISRP
jgi:hypothetical protein